MEEIGRPIRFLTYQEITEIHRIVINRFGGFSSGAGVPMNPGSLKYLVEKVKSEGYDSTQSDIFIKAAVYACHIITRHVFSDGNKRTGMICTLYFLGINGYSAQMAILEEEIIEISLGIANRIIDPENLSKWLKTKFTS